MTKRYDFVLRQYTLAQLLVIQQTCEERERDDDPFLKAVRREIQKRLPATGAGLAFV